MSAATDRRSRLRHWLLKAGRIHGDYAARRSSLVVEHKGSVDLVTEADRRVQEFLLERLAEELPSDHVVAEESDLPRTTRSTGATWYVDPIDGTTNFVHGHLFSCISMARWVDGQPEVAGVFAPQLDELYLAGRSEGAWLERPARGQAPIRLQVSHRDCLQDALVATGFPYERGELARFNLALSAHFIAHCQGVRRAGSAALDLCWVAAGRLDAYWEMSLHPWDVAAGLLMVLEAGGKVGDFEGDGLPLDGRRVLVSAPEIFDECLRVLASGHDDPDIDVLAPPLDAPVSRRGPLPGESP